MISQSLNHFTWLFRHTIHYLLKKKKSKFREGFLKLITKQRRWGKGGNEIKLPSIPVRIIEALLIFFFAPSPSMLISKKLCPPTSSPGLFLIKQDGQFSVTKQPWRQVNLEPRSHSVGDQGGGCISCSNSVKSQL